MITTNKIIERFQDNELYLTKGRCENIKYQQIKKKSYEKISR